MSVKTNPRYLEWPYIPLSQKWQPNGVATLDANGLVPLSQLPPFASGGVNYDTPTTVWSRMVRSIWPDADTISETGINIDGSDNVSGINNLTTTGDANIGGDLNVAGTSTFDGDAVFNDSVTIWNGPLIFDNTVTQGDQIFDNTYTANYNGSTLNYTSVIQNYVAPALISCATLPSFGVTYAYPANATQVEVKVTNTAVQYTLWQAVDQGVHTYSVGAGTVTINTTLTGVVVTSVTGTNTLDSACFYTGNVINQNGVIQNNTNNTQNNTGGTVNNTNQTINNTNTTTVGGTYTGVTLTNVTITGNVAGVGVKVWPITWSTAGVSETVSDPLSTANSVVNGISVVTWTPNWNYFDFDVSAPWSIVFTSKDFLWNSVSESGLVFYYTINY